MALKKSEIIVPIIIAEVDSWLLLFILKTINFNLLDFLTKINKLSFYPFLNLFLKFLPLILPILAILYIFVASLFKEKKLTIFQLFKFMLVGSLNTFIDFSVLNLLMLIFNIASGWFYTLFKAVSFTLAVVNSYFFNKFWTFQKFGKPKAGEFVKFYLITIIGLLINVSVASFIVNIIGPQFGLSKIIWANIGAFIAVLVAFLWNFFGSKIIVFKK